jgi:muramoyltetrapeptide carboxypeptidase
MGPQSSVGVVSLASCVDANALRSGCAALHELSGWQVTATPAAPEREGEFAGGFAGSPEHRARALMEMWQRNDVDAIVCARGGYGCNYLLPLFDFDALRMMPKIFVGYSDNTSLLLALDRAGLVAFHGPMVASDFATGRVDEDSFLGALQGRALERTFPAGSQVSSLVEGHGHAPIIGGCLSLVVASIGTPWEINAAGKILFLEDVNEKAFRIDRMLMQLLLAGKFAGVRGIIFGAMTGCGQGRGLGCSPASSGEEDLPQTIRRILGGLGIPIVMGFPSGHVEAGNITLPFGVPAVLESNEEAVRLSVEAATFYSVL